jgi:PAS domain S-box-containing protein
MNDFFRRMLLHLKKWEVFASRSIQQQSTHKRSNALSESLQSEACPRPISDHHRITTAISELKNYCTVLRLLVDASPDLLFLYDISVRECLYVSRQIFTVLGFSPGEVETMGTLLLENLLHPDDVSLFSEQIRRLILLKDGEVDETECRLKHANGEWRWFHCRGTVLVRDSNGTPQQILGAARDITERKRNEEMLRDQEILAALGRMASRVAHEINNPLANIKNSLFLLKSTALRDHPDVKYLQWTEEEVDRITQVVKKITTPALMDI